MVAGMPGTGIGGIFYFLLVVFMPIRELYRAVRGQSSLSRWAFILFHISLVIGILAAMWGTMWALNNIIQHLPAKYASAVASGSLFGEHVGVVAAASAFAGLISLTFVAFLVHLLRFVLRVKDFVQATPKPA
jgi:cytochrome c biogenesis protein ResB